MSIKMYMAIQMIYTDKVLGSYIDLIIVTVNKCETKGTTSLWNE